MRGLMARRQIDAEANKRLYYVAYGAYARQAGFGFTNRQLEDIWSRIDIEWFPVDVKHGPAADMREGSGALWYQGRWKIQVELKMCLEQTTLLHSYLHVLRAETHGLDQDMAHRNDRVWGPAPSAEWMALEAWKETEPCP
jgi:hypothetical protein